MTGTFYLFQSRQLYVLSSFFTQLPKATTEDIYAVASATGQAYQSAVQTKIDLK